MPIRDVHARRAGTGLFDRLAAAGRGRSGEHPDIVTVHDVVIHDGRPWIVMELIEGRSLAQVIGQDGALPEREAARIGLRVLGALRAQVRAAASRAKAPMMTATRA